MIELFTQPEVFISLFTLTLLEVVLGIDNIVFISILSGKLKENLQLKARRIGIIIGMAVRILMLSLISLILRLENPIINIDNMNVHLSGKDLILILGGLFLLYQSTKEIHHKLEGEQGGNDKNITANFSSVIMQMFFLNFVFSIDSVITAIGMTKHVSVMMIAIVLSVIVMMIASETISNFVHKHPTIKILALSFLLLIGFTLIVEGLHFHIPKGYVYFAMLFSFLVDLLQLRLNKPTIKPVDLREDFTITTPE
jgi:predicted tellurium resistance membrane protein TerC